MIPLWVSGQNLYVPLEQEYAIGGGMVGDQSAAQVSVTSQGGYVVWQDNTIDGMGLGIGARRLNNTLSGQWEAFRVNERGELDQQNPRVAVLTNGGAMVVWQGGVAGLQDIYARFLGPEGTFLTGDILVNTYTNDHQGDATVACLAGGNFVVGWSSYNQDGSLQGIYAQRFTPDGQKVGGEFRVATTSVYNQREPSVAALDNGNFVMAWVNDYVSATGSTFTNWGTTNNVVSGAQIFVRIFDAGGVPVTGELVVSSNAQSLCASPGVGGLPGGAFTVVWNQQDSVNRSNSWDIMARPFSGSGLAGGLAFRVNANSYGDQYQPRVASLGGDQLVVWTSLGQDGSHEGVFGRFLSSGVMNGEEIPVNTTVISRQMQPALASDGRNRFLAVWTCFVGGMESFDLFAQRFSATGVYTDVPPAPYVSALSSNSLHVTWPELSGYGSLEAYEVIMDDNPVVATVVNYCVVGGLAPNSTHVFRLAYRFTDGSWSPLSLPGSGTTWGIDASLDGLPDDWQRRYWPALGPSSWASADSDRDGANNLQEFLAGTDPTRAESVLRTRLTFNHLGGSLSWNTQPGLIYQVQQSANFQDWNNYGAPRFAAGTSDAAPVSGASNAGFYRVIRVR